MGHSWGPALRVGVREQRVAAGRGNRSGRSQKVAEFAPAFSPLCFLQARGAALQAGDVAVRASPCV